MLRLAERGGEHCWLLPRPPDDVDPAVLRELRMQALPVEYPNETSRVLAAALRCCWTDAQASPWPGQLATVREVLDVVDQLVPRRGEEALHRLGTGAPLGRRFSDLKRGIAGVTTGGADVRRLRTMLPMLMECGRPQRASGP